jgi:uncharacterized protein YrzB (UPF0473 family)
VSIDWEEDDCLVLEDEEGKEHEFTLIKKFSWENGEYVILQPANEDEYYIFMLDRDDDGNEFLCEIEDEDEWEQVADAYQEMVAEEEI